MSSDEDDLLAECIASNVEDVLMEDDEDVNAANELAQVGNDGPHYNCIICEVITKYRCHMCGRFYCKGKSCYDDNIYPCTICGGCNRCSPNPECTPRCKLIQQRMQFF